MNTIEQNAYENARRSYEEIQKRKRALSEKDKRLFERISKVKIGRYDDVSSETVLVIADVYGNNAINAFNSIYRLGFMKGVNAAKRNAKKGMQ